MAKCEYMSPLGRIVITTNGRAVTGLTFSDEHFFSSSDAPSAQAVRWLNIYFSGGVPDFMPPVEYTGTPLRTAVWDLLRDVSYSESVTYGELAAKAAEILGKDKMSAQAIGGAVSHNPIALIIPCHRVIGADGALGGYNYGTDRKKWLLDLENISCK